MTTPEARRERDRERKREVRAREREQRTELVLASPAHAPETSASVAAPDRLESIADVRAGLEYAMHLVASDRTGSPTRRAQVAASICRESLNLIHSETLSDRVDAIEAAMKMRQQQTKKGNR